MNRRKFIYNSSLASLSVMGLSSCNLNSKKSEDYNSSYQ